MRRLVPSLAVVLVLAACGGSESSTPLELSDSNLVTPAATPSATSPVPQDYAPGLPETGGPLDGGTGLNPEDGGPLLGPTPIGEECAEFLGPARDHLKKAQAGIELSVEEYNDLEARFRDVLEHCTADEYITFQTEMFPEEAGVGSSSQDSTGQ